MKLKEFHFRMTDKEYEKLERLAKRFGCNKSTFVRNATFNRPMVESEVAEELRKLRTEINRVGNNINQIARRWNESGSDYAHIAFLDEQMTNIYGCFREVRDYCYHKNGKTRK